jgi:hypothetical protein
MSRQRCRRVGEILSRGRQCMDGRPNLWSRCSPQNGNVEGRWRNRKKGGVGPVRPPGAGMFRPGLSCRGRHRWIEGYRACPTLQTGTISCRRPFRRLPAASAGRSRRCSALEAREEGFWRVLRSSPLRAQIDMLVACRVRRDRLQGRGARRPHL